MIACTKDGGRSVFALIFSAHAAHNAGGFSEHAWEICFPWIEAGCLIVAYHAISAGIKLWKTIGTERFAAFAQNPSLIFLPTGEPAILSEEKQAFPFDNFKIIGMAAMLCLLSLSLGYVSWVKSFPKKLRLSPQTTNLGVNPAPTLQVPPVTKPAVPKHAVQQLSDDEIARGAEPRGAPHPLISDPSVTEEQRLNRMSFSELQAYLAETVRKLKEFEEKWHYPEPQAFDPPAEGPDGKVPKEQLDNYWKELGRRQNNVYEVRPRKRAQAFRKNFPQIESLASYLYQRWPEIQGMENCFVPDKMLEGVAQGCAGYIQAVIDKLRRQ